MSSNATIKPFQTENGLENARTHDHITMGPLTNELHL